MTLLNAILVVADLMQCNMQGHSENLYNLMQSNTITLQQTPPGMLLCYVLLRQPERWKVNSLVVFVAVSCAVKKSILVLNLLTNEAPQRNKMS